MSHTGPVIQGPAFAPLSAGDPQALSGHRIDAVLGDGALGRAYLATDPGGGAAVLTVLRPEAASRPGFAARFAHDVQAAARVPGCPHTVRTLGGGRDGDRYWIATAYRPAVPLRTAVGAGGPLPTRTVLRLIAGIAGGLRVLHGHGVVHGDLRPAQVLLAAEGPALKGYGLTHLTADPAAGGGPVFLAPEQGAGAAPSGATDVFALGQVAVYASIGTAPFGTGAADQVLPRVRQEEPDLNELPGELREIVTRCLIKDPELRPSLDQVTAMCAQAAPAGARFGGRFHRGPEPWLPAPLPAAVARAALPRFPVRPAAASAPRPEQDSPVNGPAPDRATPHPGASSVAGPPSSGAPPVPGLPPAAPAYPPAAAMPTPPVVPPAPAVPPFPQARPAAGPAPVGAAPGPPPARPEPAHGFPRAPHGWPRPPHLHLPLPAPGPRRRTAALAGTVGGLAIAVTAALLLTGGFRADSSTHGAGTGAAAPAAPPRGTAPVPSVPPSPTAPGGGSTDGTGATDEPAPRDVFLGVRLPAGYALSWQDGEVERHEGAYSGDFGYTADAAAFAADGSRGTFSLIAPGRHGTLDGCRTGRPLPPYLLRASLPGGTQVCVRSAGGTTALLTIRQFADQGGMLPSIVVDISVWPVPGEPA